VNVRAALANNAWLALSLQDWLRFRNAVHYPARAQQKVLEEIESACGGTRGFPGPIDSIEPRDWEDIEPLVARVADGQADILTREPVTHFEPTSGSSSAVKLVPSTPLLRRQFNRAIHAWVADMFLGNKRLMGGPAYWSISPAATHASTRAGIRVGYEDDSEYLGRIGRWLVRQNLVVPAAIRHLCAAESPRATLLFMLAQPELRFISVWNPTFLTALMTFFDEHRNELLRQLADGVEVCGQRLQRRVGDDPWPRLELISCWADGHARSQLAGLRRWFPEVAVQPKGLLATEAFISLPFNGRKVIAVTSHFIEVETDDKGLLRVEELKEGDEGTVVVTTGGGLVRYRLGDRIAVTGFLDKTPCIEFLGRQNVVSDICGEKLNEAFVSGIIRDIAGDGFSLLVPEEAGYTLYSNSDIDADEFERRLAENPQYEWAVQIGQLRPVQVVRVSDDAAATYLEVRRSRGQRLGDIKPAALDAWPGWHEAFASIRVAGH
jgi:hypothetical protein